MQTTSPAENDAAELNDGLGGAAPRSSYFLSRSFFLRSLGVVYLIAFVSISLQIDGLVGSKGIAPAAPYLSAVHDNLGVAAYWRLPTLAWIDSSDAMLHGVCLAGVALSCGLIVGVLPQICTALLWIAYLSIVGVGQDFLRFQWDSLLLEAGFLAILFAPMDLLLSSRTNATPPSRVMIFMLRWLLFRLMFLSGLVKCRSGDPAWADWTAMSFHYETQPLPTWTSWYMHHLPMWAHKAEVVGTFAIELVVPLMIFGPRLIRSIAFAGIVLLQLTIAATGNFGFFNLLTIALCIPLLDDETWPAKWRRKLLPPADQIRAVSDWANGADRAARHRDLRVEHDPGHSARSFRHGLGKADRAGSSRQCRNSTSPAPTACSK